MNHKAKGTAKERQTRKLLEAEGWKVIRPGASLGAADLIAMKAGCTPLAVQVKCNGQSPWMNFRPVERTELKGWAKEAGCVPLLAYWPPRASTHQLIAPVDWPD